MTAAKALQLGIVDQVTDQNAVEVAVKFAQSVAGKALRRQKWGGGGKASNVTPRFSLSEKRAPRRQDGILAGRLFLGLSDIKER